MVSTKVISKRCPRVLYDEKYNVLFIGRCKEKSHVLLLQAVAKSRYRDQIRLVFAGQGPREEILRQLKDLAKSQLLNFLA